MGIEFSKPSQISPTPQKREIDDDEAFDRTLIIKIDDDDDPTFFFGSNDDPTLHSPEDQQNNSSKVTRVITFHVCSTKLANKSPFFEKMFSIGMKESGEDVVTLKIGGYEEAAFKDMMNYMESNKVPRENHTRLLELLMIADRFEVLPCVKSCVDSLISAMDHELALLVWNIPRTIAEIGDIGRLTDKSEMFFRGLTNFHGFPDDLGGINRRIIECVLLQDHLRLDSEDEAYDFLMKWVMSHLSDPEERREFLQANVTKLIRFPYLSNSKLSLFYKCCYVEEELKNETRLEMELYRNKKDIVTPLSNKLRYSKRRYKDLPVTVSIHNAKDSEVIFEMDSRDFGDLRLGITRFTHTFRVAEREFDLVVVPEHSGSLAFRIGLRIRKWRYVIIGSFDLSDSDNPTEWSMARKVSVAYHLKSSWCGWYPLVRAEWNTYCSSDSSFFNKRSGLLIRFDLRLD